MRDLVDDILLVSEKEIKAAMKFVLERMKLVIEPSAACGVGKWKRTCSLCLRAFVKGSGSYGVRVKEARRFKQYRHHVSLSQTYRCTPLV